MQRRTRVEQGIMAYIKTFSHPDCTVGFGVAPNPIFSSAETLVKDSRAWFT
jgi:hypothetical protein